MNKTEKYNYLKKYINNENTLNYFQKISISEIKKAEKKIGFEFPSQLKDFWQEIGCGFLKASVSGENMDLDNRIMSPEDIENIFLLEDTDGLILLDIAEDIEPGYIAFFHIGDSSSFLLMNPKGKNPNVVYHSDGSILENSFETFIYKLYYDSPGYFLYHKD